MILDIIVAKKKEEVALLKSNGVNLSIKEYKGTHSIEEATLIDLF